MTANELKQQAEALGISLSFDANFWNMGPCVIATFPTHNGGGCDSALAWMKNFSSRDDAESYALKVAIRNASPGDSAREVESETARCPGCGKRGESNQKDGGFYCYGSDRCCP